MSDFKDEIEDRFEKRHKNKISTWTNLLVRVILLIVVIMIIRFLADPETEKFRNFIMGSKTNSSNIQQIGTE